MCTILVSLDWFIPLLLGRWSCTVRGCTHHHTLVPQQGGLDRGQAQQQNGCFHLMLHRRTGAAALLSHWHTSGWLCHVLLACMSSGPRFYLVAGTCALVPGEGVSRPTSLLLLQAEAGRGGSTPVFAVMRVLERQGAIFSFDSVLGYNFS